MLTNDVNRTSPVPKFKGMAVENRTKLSTTCCFWLDSYWTIVIINSVKNVTDGFKVFAFFPNVGYRTKIVKTLFVSSKYLKFASLRKG